MTTLRHERLKLDNVFRLVYRRGRWAHSPSVSVGACPNRRGVVRLGLRTKRGLKGAVIRNRLKRQLRAIYQARHVEFIPGHDIVVVLHPKRVPTPISHLEQDLLKTCRRLGLIS